MILFVWFQIKVEMVNGVIGDDIKPSVSDSAATPTPTPTNITSAGSANTPSNTPPQTAEGERSQVVDLRVSSYRCNFSNSLSVNFTVFISSCFHCTFKW